MNKKFKDLKRGDYIYTVLDRKLISLLIVNNPQIIEKNYIRFSVSSPDMFDGNRYIILIPWPYVHYSYWGVFGTDNSDTTKLGILTRLLYLSNKDLRHEYNKNF
jgi:hypothetical protein